MTSTVDSGPVDQSTLPTSGSSLARLVGAELRPADVGGGWR